MSETKPTPVSHIHGTGHGDAHAWKYVASHGGGSFYRCSACPAEFTHFYDKTPDIFAAMKAEGVPVTCEPSGKAGAQ